MMDIEFSKSATEVLSILNNMESRYIDKIPNKFMAFLEKNKLKEYAPNFDFSKPIKELNLNKKTHTLLGIIYYKYWANEEEKKVFREKIKQNEIKYQEELRIKYNPNVFQKRLKK